jgi:hypothetical protein
LPRTLVTYLTGVNAIVPIFPKETTIMPDEEAIELIVLGIDAANVGPNVWVRCIGGAAQIFPFPNFAQDFLC